MAGQRKKNRVRLRYVTEPKEEQLEKLGRFAASECGIKDPDPLCIVCKPDPSLKSGFVLDVNSREYDWSGAGRLAQMEELLKGKEHEAPRTVEGVIPMLKKELSGFRLYVKGREVGCVTWVGDGIAELDGVEHAMYGEIVVFENGVKGMVQDIRRDRAACILLGRDTGICQGMRAVRTGKSAGLPVGEGFLGRIVDPLGEPVDGGGPIAASEYRAVEQEAPGIAERQSVSVPLETGILSIDSMFPIGRGQRELIIGDRQTGKTSLAVDAVLNQKGKDVICIYVAIGQKASTVAKLVHTLKSREAMEYTVVMAASAADPAALQYIAPYAGCALAEYFMHRGRDVLIVYDDLSKHAVAYRAMSLLLGRSPGREAYPGDVFYLHSRLLERACRLNREKGGGSITALPIIETQAGDVSAYIPTNVISITDGQIFLESELFFSGLRPAVNVGLSVSRVGGAAQSGAMKQAAGSIRVELAQYREMEVFTQFASDLDETARKQLRHGRVLMELLKQPLCSPFSMAEQVVILTAASAGRFDEIPLKEVGSFRAALLGWLADQPDGLLCRLQEKGQLSVEDREEILAKVQAFQAEYASGRMCCSSQPRQGCEL